MNKKRMDFSKKLMLNKNIVSDLSSSQKQQIAGGEDSDFCVSGKYNLCNYTMQQSCRNNCITGGELTCIEDQCATGPSNISCNVGPGCASGNTQCFQVSFCFCA